MDNNIFVFDFDDTIFPTSSVKRYYNEFTESFELPLELIDNLQLHDNLVHQLFTEIINHNGTILIFTNASFSWIEEMLYYYMPKTSDFIDYTNIMIVSCYDNVTQFISDKIRNDIDPILWKYFMLSTILSSISYHNLYNIGDSHHEMTAMTMVHSELSNCTLINLKINETDNIFDYIHQFNRIIDFVVQEYILTNYI